MYLSDRDLQWAIQTGRLIIEPKPDAIDPTSIDLHLDRIEEARVWDIQSYKTHNEEEGRDGPAELRIAKISYKAVAKRYQIPPPEDPSATVFRRGREIVAKPHGFFLWQTREEVGTPVHGADLIAFIDGKSTRARAGLVVHMTAPTIHSSWTGKVVLEIANLGPFDLVLREGDVIAQLTVATISYPPLKTMAAGVTFGQKTVAADPRHPPPQGQGAADD